MTLKSKVLRLSDSTEMAHLAKLVRLPATPVTARRVNLAVTGVIKNYTSETDLTRLGYNYQVFVQVKLLPTKQTALFVNT